MDVGLSYSGVIVLEESNYYPFGLKHQGYNDGSLLRENGTHYTYQYNGKELQETGMYDYGARFYIPDLGRWGVMDAMSEKYTSYSPYNYAINNPVMFIDPDGNDSVLHGPAAQQAFTDFKANMSSSSGNTYFTGLDFSHFGGEPNGNPKPGFWERMGNLFRGNKGTGITSFAAGTQVSRAVHIGEIININAQAFYTAAGTLATRSLWTLPLILNGDSQFAANSKGIDIPATEVDDGAE